MKGVYILVLVLIIVSCTQQNANQITANVIAEEHLIEEIKEVSIKQVIEKPKCPESCNDKKKCTKDICSEKTNYECTYKEIMPCCGNDICDEGETYEICPSECSLPKEYLFKFVEKKFDCDFEGEFILNNISIGKLKNNNYLLTLEEYSKYKLVNLTDIKIEMKEWYGFNYFDSNRDEYCINGTFQNCDYDNWRADLYCWNFEHNESYFNGSEEQINITFKPNWPYSYAMMNFITPNEVGWYFDEKIRLKGEDYQEDIDKIHKMMSAKLYLLDSISSESKTKEYWTLPTESLSKMQLDCEDWATSFISLMKNFDPEIKCFNVGVPWHLTTFCKYDEKYVFFDQNNFMIKTYVRDDYPYSKKYDKVRNWVETFFDSFGYPSYLWIVESAFDEKNYYEFEHRKDFIKWAIEQ